MKKTRSTTLRRAWPSSDFSDRASERTRSRSEKDYRLYKHYPKPFITHSFSHSPRMYMPTGGSAYECSMMPPDLLNVVFSKMFISGCTTGDLIH